MVQYSANIARPTMGLTILIYIFGLYTVAYFLLVVVN